MIYQCLLLSCNDLNVTHVDFSIPYSCCNCELAMRSVLLAQLLMANHEISSGFSSTKWWHINIFVMQITSFFVQHFGSDPTFGEISLNVGSGLNIQGNSGPLPWMFGMALKILGNSGPLPWMLGLDPRFGEISLNVGSGRAFIKKTNNNKTFH